MKLMEKEIIIVLHSLAIGGAERRLSSVANYMAGKGIKVHMLLIDSPAVCFDIDRRVKVVCVNQNIDKSLYEPEKCELFRLDKLPETSAADKLKLRAYRLADKKKAEHLEAELYLKNTFAVPLREYIKQHPNAVVVSFMTIPNISLMMAMQNLPNRTLFGDCCDISTEYPDGSPFNEMRRRYFSRADGAIFQTPAERDYYTFLPDVEKYVIPNFIRGELFPECFEGERRKDIVNFCRLSPAKDLPLLIDAFALLHKDLPEYTLSIYGEGSLKDKLTERIIALGLQDCAKIYPFDKEVHKIIRDAAMFVSSSYREGISNSMLEALAIGMPCVCTDCAGGGAKMMIEDHENGLLVPMKDTNALYLAMKEVAENKELADKLSRNAVKIKERLAPERIINEMIEAVFGEKG